MRRTMIVLACVQAVDVAAFTLLLPMSRAVMQRFGLSPAGMLLLLGVFPLAAVPGAALLMRQSRLWGDKAALVAAGLLMAEALFVLAWAGDVYMLFLSRIAAGFAAGSFLPAEVWQQALGRPLPLRWSASAAGAVGGLLLVPVFGPLGYSWPAYVAGATAAVLLVWLVAMLDQRAPASADRSGRHAAPYSSAR